MFKTCRRRILIFTSLAVLSALTLTAQQPSPKKMKFYERLLFAPSQHPEGNWRPNGIKFEDVWFRSKDGTVLHGWLCKHPHAKGLLIYAHGNAGHLADRSYLIPRLQQTLPVHVFLFDYRGYGRSEGNPTIEGVVEDAEAALTIAGEKSGMTLENTIFMGRSLGGAVMTQLAAKHPPRALIIESSFSSLRAVGQKHFPGLALIVPKKAFDSAKTLKQYKGPLFISHGDADTVIPYKQGEQLFNASGTQPPDKVFFRIRNGNHNDALPADYYRQLGDFIKPRL